MAEESGRTSFAHTEDSAETLARAMEEADMLGDVPPAVTLAIMRHMMPRSRTLLDDVAAWLIADPDFDWIDEWETHKEFVEKRTRNILEKDGQSCNRPLADLDAVSLIGLRTLKTMVPHISTQLLAPSLEDFWFSSGSDFYRYDGDRLTPDFPVYYRCKHEFFLRCNVGSDIQARLFDIDCTYEDITNLATEYLDPQDNEERIDIYNYILFVAYTEWGSKQALHKLVERLNSLLVHFELKESKGTATRLLQMLDIVLTVSEDCGFPIIYKLPVVRYKLPEPPILAEEYFFFNTHMRGYHATTLANSYLETGDLEKLDWAIAIQQQLIRLLPRDNFNVALRLADLSTMLKCRAGRDQSLELLQRAVRVSEEAVRIEETRPGIRDGLPLYLDRLGDTLGHRFDMAGDMKDLDRAIDFTGQAATTAASLEQRSDFMTNHARWLAKKYEKTRILRILDSTIDVAEKVIEATAKDRREYTNGLGNLAIYLAMRSERTEKKEDIDRAIELMIEVIKRRPEGHTGRPNALANLASHLGQRAKGLWPGWQDDLDHAIEASQTALDCSGNRDIRHRILTNMTGYLGKKAVLNGQSGTMDRKDLDRAVETARLALESTPGESPDRAIRLLQLGMYLRLRFKECGDIADLNETLSFWKEGLAWKAATPSIHARIAYQLAKLLSTQSEWSEAFSYYEKAVKLIPLVTDWTLANSDKLDSFEHFHGLASAGAAAALQAGKGTHAALELLEMGRCVTAGLLLGIRSDITTLKEQHPDLAAEFVALRNELDAPIQDSGPVPTDTNFVIDEIAQKAKTSQRLDELLEEIRGHSGFETFLLPPKAKELQAAASSGPIVIVNMSAYRCDAFLIERQQITVLPLPDLKLDDANKKAKQPRLTTDTLQWLWTTVTAPVLSKLGYTKSSSDQDLPHIWWIPTGPLSQLPLHAAGVYGTGSQDTVLDRCMSSYASSVRALIYGRQSKLRKALPSDQKLALLVSMQHTPNLSWNSDLPFASEEVESVTELVKSINLDPIRPPPRRKDVLANLGACHIFHFAGHGESDPRDPSKSRLLLEDWEESPLTVGDLQEHRVQNDPPFLGYLSACSTASNKVDRLVDESVHLVSAFQLAGFRHVIGTLWAVSDSHCVDVARIVYETLRDEGLTDLAVCRGLHRAVKHLRLSTSYVKMRGPRDIELLDDEEEEECKVVLGDPALWAPYIHYGV